MTRRKKVRTALVPCVAVLVAVPLTLRSLEDSDRRHQRFYNSGKTINGFLSSYCRELEKAHAAGDGAGLLALYSGRYHSPERGRWELGEEEPMGDVVARRLSAEGTEDYRLAELDGELSGYLGGIEAFERTTCKIDLIEEIELERTARLTVKLVADGIDSRGRAFQDRFFYRWHLTNEAGDGVAYDWKIRRDEMVEGIRVAGNRRGLMEVDAAAVGIDFVHRRNPHLDMKRYRDELKFGVIQHASGGISAADYDQDGRPDLFFLDGERCRLFRNEGAAEDGTLRFRDVTAEVGLDGIGQAHVGLFADFDNDGDRDLFVGRYLATNLLFENESDGGGRVVFRDATHEMGLGAVMPTTSATLLDYDRDGFVDLYLGVGGNAFEALPRLPFYATNGQPNRLYRNDGGRRFVDVTDESGTGDTGWGLAVAAGDVDGDGLPDLGVANDFGRKSLYLNAGDGTFTEVAKEAGVLDIGPGMGLAFSDFDDDGHLDLYTSNVNSNQRWFGEDMTVTQYLRNVLRTRWLWADATQYWEVYRLLGNDWIELGKQFGEGNSLFRNRGGGAAGTVAFEELRDSHTERAGWGWGVAFFDLDNDTDLDLYAANGWISNAPGTDL